MPVSDALYEVMRQRTDQVRPFVSMDKAVKNLRGAIKVMCPSSQRVLAEKGAATLHSCRDTYATCLLNRGLSLEKVSHLLGHSTLSQTQKYAKFAQRPTAEEARQILNGVA